MLMRALMTSIALAAVTTSATAQLSSQWQFCTGNPGIDWDTQIKSCTALIQSGTELKENEAIAFYNRALAYENKEKYDLAMLISPRRYVSIRTMRISFCIEVSTSSESVTRPGPTLI